jgi:hypothetical protein
MKDYWLIEFCVLSQALLIYLFPPRIVSKRIKPVVSEGDKNPW